MGSNDVNEPKKCKTCHLGPRYVFFSHFYLLTHRLLFYLFSEEFGWVVTI